MPPHPSPISPGLSWYEASVDDSPAYPEMDGARRADVVVVGGGYTGLSAAYHLAKQGAEVVLIDAARFGDGASGRNGGQFGTGQRTWAEDLEKEYGFERARALFGVAEEAKAHLLDFARAHEIDMDYTPGQISVVHKPRYMRQYERHAELMAQRFGYPHLRVLDKADAGELLGSTRYHGGLYDSGTGHIHPLKLLIGLAKAAQAAGAQLYEDTKATKISTAAGRIEVETARGTITAKHAFLAVNAYGGDLEPTSAAHVMPIRSFIGATVPLGDDSPVIPGGESVDDSRFVVRYFRRTRDGRLLFGGREAYTADNPRDISAHIRRQIAEIYPALDAVEITHAWGGSVGITMPRQPFVREVMPGVVSAGGYSGHGVMLANYMGRLYAEALAGRRDKLKLFEELRIPPFPGGRALRTPLLFLALSWYALMDRI